MKFSDLSGTGFPGGVILVVGVIWAVLAFLVQLAFAIAIYRDAEQNLRPQKKLVFVNPFTWALAAMISSVAGVGLYWLLHHSSLRTSSDTPRV